MPDKKIYRIDENALREKLTNYSVSFNADSLRFLENEVAQVKTHNPIELPETKKIVQFIGIPVAIAVLGFAAYFGFNYIKNLPTTAPKKDSIAIVKPIVAPKVEVKKETPPPANTSSIVTIPEAKKQDTIIATITPPIKNKEKKSPADQTKPFKKDTTQVSKIEKTKLDSLDKKSKQDTSSVSKNKDTSPKKKKKKRKNTLDATDDIRKSQPNSADDDVVVPDNNPQ
jgi:hypothetical protein